MDTRAPGVRSRSYRKIRQFFSGTLLLSGAISTGRDIAAAQMMGADLAYMGTRFIATQEALVSQSYKDMIVSSGAADIIYTPSISSIPASFMRQSIVDAGLDPDKLAPPMSAWTSATSPSPTSPSSRTAKPGATSGPRVRAWAPSTTCLRRRVGGAPGAGVPRCHRRVRTTERTLSQVRNRSHDSYNTLEYSVADGILTLWLNRPEQMNSFTVEMAHELSTRSTAPATTTRCA